MEERAAVAAGWRAGNGGAAAGGQARGVAVHQAGMM